MTDLAELVTVLVVTSPTASDPDTTAITTTLESVKAYDALASARVFVGADGVRPEQRDLTDAYHRKINDLREWMDRHSSVHDSIFCRIAWGHQANVMRMLLEYVTTPLVLFMEHDTPLTVAADVKIDWEGCAETILSGELHLIRFLHESRILPDYQHLMVDHEAQPDRRVPYLRTAQWSQRPHLADTDWYRNLIDTYFAPSSRTMIEDCMVGVVNYFWREQGEPGLHPFRLGIYADPEPTMQRSYHLDGRGSGSKYQMLYAYLGETPEGAPAATLSRVWE